MTRSRLSNEPPRDRPFRRTNRRNRAADADGTIQIRIDRIRRTRRADSGRRRARSRSHRHDRSGGAALSPRRRPRAWRSWRAAASRASRSRAFSALKEFWGLPLQLSAATLVPRPDTETVVELGARNAARHPRSGSPAAHRRHRHRLRRDFTGAVVRIARGFWSRHRHQRGCVANRKRQCRRSGTGRSRRIRRLRLCGGAVGSVRPDRVEPALYPLAPISPGSRSRSAITIRFARWTAAPTDLTPIARSFRRPRGCWRPAAHWWWKPDMAKAAISRN